MSAQQGQTDSILKVTLPSTILHARWLDDHVAKGGKARLEVATFYVGEGAPIKLTFKDLAGKTVGTLEGKVVSNLHRTAFAPTADNTTGGMTFEAELPKHGLKAKSGAIKVWPPVDFTDLKFLDKDGKNELKEIKEGIPAGCEAKVKNLKDGDKVLVSVYLRTDMVMQDGRLFAETQVPVKNGKVHLGFGPKILTALDKLKIQLELDKEGGKYFQPEYLFAVSALGTRKLSAPVKVVQELTLHFWESPGLAGFFEGKQVEIIHPDGKKEKKMIPKDCAVPVKKSKPGKHKVIPPEGKPVKPEPPAAGGDGIKLDDDGKSKIISTTAKIESGEAAYAALNLDYEFEGRFDYEKGWWKKKQARPDAQNRKVTQSKYFDSPEHVGLSYGLIQFTQQYMLGVLLKDMKAADAGKFESVFGEHWEALLSTTSATGPAKEFEEEVSDNLGTPMGKIRVKRKPSAMPVGGHDLWQPYWTARFKEAAKHPPFQKCQDKLAAKKYLDPVVVYARSVGLNPISQKSLSLLFDRKVQEGNVKKHVDGLLAAKDEKGYWTKAIAKQERALRERMNRIVENAEMSWETKYAL